MSLQRAIRTGEIGNNIVLCIHERFCNLVFVCLSLYETKKEICSILSNLKKT